MPMTLTRFTHYVDDLHATAQRAHQQTGAAPPVLMLLPERSDPQYIVLPAGTPKTDAGRADLRQRAAELAAVAAALTAESWMTVPSIRPEQLPNTPLADIARPAEAAPADRAEAIATSAWWPTGPDGPVGLQRVSIIERTAFGSTFTDTPFDTIVHSPGGGGIAAFLTDLLTP
ncbi:hypothetical protein ABH935_007022 [Catenulispora sp. GAS73]|uniref:hypothetical protein n=1 Tax=Catenulispora sp. GAS73 TaxID=3156269 RepID=UPI00351531E2